MTYMTRQQQAVLACIERFGGGCATAAELTEELHREGQSIGLTTVYRQLEKLSRQGLVHKLVTDEGACYQYCSHADKNACFLLKCEGCGAISTWTAAISRSSMTTCSQSTALPSTRAARCFTAFAPSAGRRSSHETTHHGAFSGAFAACGALAQRLLAATAGKRGRAAASRLLALSVL